MFTDDAVPSSVTLEDDVTVIAQTPQRDPGRRHGGELAIVDAGSVRARGPYTMVAGVPARVVREFGPEDVEA